MKTQYLLDSNVLIRACYVGTPEQEFVLKFLASGLLHVSVLNIAEVLVGASEAEAKKLEAIFSCCHIHDLDESIARKAANMRKQKLKSSKVFLIDCLIAATAKEIGAVVVTNNTKDFKFKGLATIKS